MARSRLPGLIAVIHLPPLAGSPRASREHPSTALEKAGLRAVAEARALEKAGFEGLVLENFGDVPFFKDQVPPETVASMAVIAAAVRQAVKVPIGINVLRNDARAALAIASVTDCQFLRVNVLSGLVAADQGLIEGDAAGLLRERERLGARPWIFADAQVKHARTLSPDDIGGVIHDLASRSGADAAVVTGAATGKAAELPHVEAASAAARKAGIPLFLGSGVSRENIARFRRLVDGVIISSDLRQSGRAGAGLDAVRVREFVKAFEKAPTNRPRLR
ncbi:MAG TPA: BtpA/SgcQ family protein [Bdellovibrionota bacterium]|nr:BtpA/SgcQ family protein [Bdellovibrionota bacterium]